MRKKVKVGTAAMALVCVLGAVAYLLIAKEEAEYEAEKKKK